MYKNYKVQRLLFLHNMVTEVMHVAIIMFIWMGESQAHLGDLT